MDTEAINVVPATAAIPLVPRAPKAAIARELQIQSKIGSAIREHRLRDYHELDIARQEKQEWVQRCTELLNRSFNHCGAADLFNDWVASILPEYAEFGMFVELFNDEMKHRLSQLRAIAKSLRDMPEPLLPPMASSPTKGTDMVTVTESSNVAASTSSTSAEVAAPVIAQAMQAAQAQASLRTQAQRAAAGATSATTNQSASSRSSSVSSVKSGLLIVRTTGDDATAEAVRQFIEQLGLSLLVSKRAENQNAPAPAPDQADSASSDVGTLGTPLLDELSVMQSSSASFALLLTASADQPQQSADSDALFDLGCCVGKLGAQRVIVLHRAGQPHTDRFGLSHIVVDDYDGWRLQLARHLKRAGVEVDLNRLI